MFDHGVVTAALLTTDPKAELDRLRERMRRMEDGQARPELEVLPGLSQVIRLRAGGSYQVDSASLALALMAGPSQGGAWCAAERAVLGFSYLEVGAELLRAWKFPVAFAAGAEFWQTPAKAPESQRSFVALLHAARHVAASLGPGLADDGFLFELQADLLSVYLLNNARYPVRGSVAFWRNFGPSKAGGILRSRSHPAWRDRVATLEAEIAKVEPISARPIVPALIAERSQPLSGDWQSLLVRAK